MPSSKAPTYPYARFIPREEIEAVSSWRFDNVDGTPHPEDVAAAAAQQEAEEAARALSPEAIAADMEALRRQAIDESFAQGHAAGCQETRAALEEPARQAAEAAARRLNELVEGLRAELDRAQEHMAQAVLEMACELARQVVRRELLADPKSIEPVVNEALAALVTDAQPIAIRLHPDDLAALQAGGDTQPTSDAPRWVADASITPGGCVVEAPGSGVDATLEKRWQRAIANLGLDSEWASDKRADDHAPAA